jgi:hypothetical protein
MKWMKRKLIPTQSMTLIMFHPQKSGHVCKKERKKRKERNARQTT